MRLAASLLIVIGCLGLFALGITQGSNVDIPDPIEAEIQRLGKEIETQKLDLERLTGDVNALQTGVANNTTIVNELRHDIDKFLSPRVTENRGRIIKLEERNDIIDGIVRQLGEITAEGSDGNYVLNLRSSMANSSFMSDFSQAVHHSFKGKGTLSIHNATMTQKDIFVDGNLMTILPNETRKLTVQSGTIATRLPGKSTITWMVSPPNYSEEIQIVETWREVNSIPWAEIP